MKRLFLLFGVVGCILFCGCTQPDEVILEKGENVMYQQISSKKAKEIMDSKEEFILLDVREQEEFDAGHLPGAILIPYTEIEAKAPELLLDKEQQILVYCRSGRRSKIASEVLAYLGYTNVKEFGGIIDWPYEVVQ